MSDHEKTEAPDLRLVLAALTAVMDGDRYLDATAAALVIGNLAPATFRQVASRPGFPKAVKIGKGRKWRRRELLEWADRERDRQNRAA
jgi:predicted DNA-binding transcriptional regulator AlpA